MWQQLWFCWFPIPLSSELPSGVTAEHCRGTQSWDSLPRAEDDRSWQPHQSTAESVPWPQDAWRGARGGFPAIPEQWFAWHSSSSPQEFFLGLAQGKGGESWTHLQSWHITCHALLYSTSKGSSKSEGPLRTSAGVSFQDFPFLCTRKQGIWFRKSICLLGRAWYLPWYSLA